MKFYTPRDEHGNKLLTAVDLKQVEQDLSVDQSYNAESEKAQSGKAVAEAIKDLATKSDLTEHENDSSVHITEAERTKWNGLSDTESELSNQITQHIADTTKHVTPEEKAGWNDKYTKSEVDAKLSSVSDRLETVESTEVDQRYNPYSENAQSGFAVAEAVEDMATKEELNSHVSDTEKHVTTEEKVKWNDKYTIHEVDEKIGGIKDQLSKELASKEDLSKHVNDISVHVTVEDKVKWNDKYTIHEVDQKLSGLSERIEPLENIVVDQNYSPFSNNPQSGHAVADAISGLVTSETFNKHVSDADVHISKAEKAEWNDKYTKKEIDDKLAQKVEQSDIAGFADRIEDVEDAIAAEALKNLTNSANLASHVSNKEIHITRDERLKWNASSVIDQTYNPESQNAQSGTAVAGAIRDLATKSEVDAIEEKIPSTASAENQLADKAYVNDSIHKGHAHFRGSWDTHASVPTEPSQYPADVDGNHKPLKDDYIVIIKDENHEGHTWEYRYTGAWDTNGKDGWKAIYEITSSPLTSDQFAALDSGITKELVQQIGQKADQSDLDSLDGRVEALESKPEAVVDQSYNEESTNAQSGTAVAEAIKDLATKDDVSQLSTKVEEIEGSVKVTVDQNFNATSENPQSGKAVEDAFKQHRTVTGATGTAYMANETNGGLMKFTKTTGEMAKVTLFDGSDSEKTYIQLIAHNADKSKGGKLHFTTDGAFYTTTMSGAVATADNELLTKKDIKDLATKSELDQKANQSDLTELDTKVGTLEGTISAEALKNLATEAELKEHKADTSAHVTEELRSKLEQAYTKEELDSKLSDVTDRVDSLETSITIDQTYNPESECAQSGKAVAEAVTGLASNADLLLHTLNKGIHVTTEDKTKWNAKLDADAIADMATKTELAEKAAQSDLDALGGRVDAIEAKPEAVVDQAYNAKSTNAQSGTAVAEAIRSEKIINTNGTVAYMANEPNGGLIKLTKSSGEMAKVTLFDGSDGEQTYIQMIAHNADKSKVSKLHFTTEGAYYTTATSGTVATTDNELVTKKDIKHIASDSTVSDLRSRIQALEEKPEITVDQSYNGESANPQSGTAVAESIKDLATKAEVEERASQSDLDTLDGRVDALEAKPDVVVDQTYNAASENAQSGKAVAEAIYNQRNIQNEGNFAYMSNETTGGIIKFTKSTGEGGKITAYDGSDSDGTYAQISAFNQDKSQVAKLNFTLTGAYYSKASSGAVAVPDNEILTKGDIKDVATKTELAEKADQSALQSLTERVESVESIEVDQTYNGESTNAQSGTAVAEAIEGLASNSDLTTHTSNEEIHVNLSEKSKWDQAATDVATKADQSELQSLTERIESIEGKPEITVDQTYSSTSENPQSGKAVAEAVKDLVSNSTVTELSGRVEALEAKPDPTVDQAYNAQSTNAQSGKSVAEAIQKQRVIENEGNTAYMSNETTGGVIKFTKSTGEFGKVTTYDGSDSDGTYVQIVASNQDKSSLAKINLTLTGAYYSKDSSGAVATEDNEIVTKKDIEHIASDSVVSDLTDRVEALEGKPEPTVDQTYNAESENAQSGKAVTEAIKDLATKSEVAEKADQSALQSLTERVETVESVEVDQTYSGESTNAQSGTAVAEAIESLAKNADLSAHTSNTDVHVTTSDKSTWNAKLDASAIADMATKTELVDKADKSVVDELIGKVPAAASAENQLADKSYVADMIRNNTAHFRGSWNTKADIPSTVDDYPQDVDGNKTPGKGDYLIVLHDEDHEGHTWEYRYTGVWDTNGVDGWTAIYEISDSPLSSEQLAALDSGITKELVQQIGQKANQADLDTLDGRVDALEAKPDPTVDQSYSATSENAQSGKAVAESIKDLATKTEVAAKANQSELENHINDTTKHLGSITSEAGTSLLFNEADGGGMRYTKSDESGSLIAINDGTDNVYAQVSAHTKDKAKIVRLNVNPDGIYYTKNAADNTVAADNEIITKGDIKDIASSSTVTDLQDRVTALEEKPEPTVDQTYNGESKNAQSGVAVAEAIKDLATKTELAEKADQSALQTLTERVETVEGVEVDQTYNAESENAQSGTAVAEAVKDLATKTELTAHTGNSEIHVTAEKTAEWDAKVDTAALEAAKTELQGAIDAKVESVMHYKGQVATEGELPGADQVTGDVYNVEETGANYAWNGQSWDKLSEDVSGFASKSELTAHASDSKIHITDEERTKWNAKLDADAIADMATKTELAEKAAQSDLDTLDGRVDALEAKPDVVVDQTYNAASENAQSGKAVAESIKDLATKSEVNERAKQSDLTAHIDDTTNHLGAVTGENGTSLLFNEADGGGMRYTKTDESGSLIAINDGTDNVYAQVSAHTKDKVKIARLNVNPDGIYYTKNAADNTVNAENEIITKADIAHIASDSVVSDLSDRVETLEGKPEITVDQTYNAESTNPQSGTAVAEALEPLATDADLSAHTSNTDIHVTAEEKTGWNDKYTKSEVDAKLGDKANTTDLDKYVPKEVKGEAETLLTQIYAHDTDATTSVRLNVQAGGIFYTKNAEDDTVIADNEILTKADIKDVATKTELTSHTGDTDIHVTVAKKAEWDAKLDSDAIADMATETSVDGKVNAVKVSVSTNDAGAVTFQTIKFYDSAGSAPDLESREENVLYLEEGADGAGASIEVDQTYNSESENPQSGTAVAEAIKDLATKGEVNAKAAQTDLDALDTRVETLESKPDVTIDQTYDAESTNAQSGTAVAGAIKDLATKTELTDLTDRVTAVEEKPEITVDQAYNAESTNAQSGTAVAGAIADLATKTELTAHTGNSEIHVTAEKTAEWDAKLDTSALDTVKVSVDVDNAGGVTFQTIKVYDVEAAPELESREENVLYLDTGIESGSITIQQTYDPASEDAISGKGVAEAIASLATQAALTELEGKIPTVDQTYSATSENAQSGKALASAIAGKANTSDLVQISTDGGAGVVFKSIKYYSSASSAPALEEREDGVLYLIAEEA